MNRTVAPVKDREKVAARLLQSSANKFYDPLVDIDWEAPIVPGKAYHPEKQISLYGTEMWDRLTPEQRVELGRHEIGSIASNGIFFEVLLMQILLKDVYRLDPTSSHAQYALTEIADECRHSTMFAKALQRFGVPAYGPRKIVKRLAKLMPPIFTGPSGYASILVAEEILDRMQRANMNDENLQPLIRMVNRIHVLEEARHVTFARQAVIEGMAQAGPIARAWHRFLTGVVCFFVAHSLINPKVYRAVGLDPREAYQAAMDNPNFQATMQHWGERVVAFLREAGLVGGPAMWFWRRSMLIGK